MINDARARAEFMRCMDFDMCVEFPDAAHSIIRIAADLIESLAAELEQVKRERDAAVEDLKKNSYTPCATCGKRIDNKSCTEFGERMPCDMINIFRCEMYEWRGVKED